MACTALGRAAGMLGGPPGGAAGGWAENLLMHMSQVQLSLSLQDHIPCQTQHQRNPLWHGWKHRPVHPSRICDGHIWHTCSREDPLLAVAVLAAQPAQRPCPPQGFS